jgi:hypothetical protein
MIIEAAKKLISFADRTQLAVLPRKLAANSKSFLLLFFKNEVLPIFLNSINTHTL